MKNTKNKSAKMRSILVTAIVVVTGFSMATCGGDDGPAAPIMHTVTFDANGGTVEGAATKTVQVENGKTATLPTDPVNSSKFFWGWFDSKTQPYGNQFTGTTPVTADKTVYARWGSTASPTQFDVTFNANGGAFSDGGTTQIIKVYQNETVTPPVPIRNGYALTEWNRQANGQGVAFSSYEQITAAITVYAQWTQVSAGDGGLGNTLTIANAQVYLMDWDNSNETFQFTESTDTVPNLNYVTPLIGSAQLLNNVIDSNPSVTLTGGKLNVTLGTPKAAALTSLETLFPSGSGVTISTTGAKIFMFWCFSNVANFNYGPNDINVVQIVGDYDGYVYYAYSDKDVNISGTTTTSQYGTSTTYAMNAKAGWNLVFYSLPDGTGGSSQYKTGTLPANTKWVVIQEGSSTGGGNGGSLDGTWNKSPISFTVSGNEYTFKNNNINSTKGTISYDGSTITLNQTHMWLNSSWTPSTATYTFTYSLSGNTITISGSGLSSYDGAWTKS